MLWISMEANSIKSDKNEYKNIFKEIQVTFESSLCKRCWWLRPKSMIWYKLTVRKKEKEKKRKINNWWYSLKHSDTWGIHTDFMTNYQDRVIE